MTRKRPTSGTGNEKFISQLCSNSFCSFSDIISLAILSTVPASSTSALTGMIVPRILMDMGIPAEMNRSDACFSAMSLSTGVRYMAASV